ncbi:hypothetical protein ABR738_32615 [Streptomyces sp. Edi4]|uniref:hypothetical protein n=1 Tax=Streptomyces sp. Edi4 TaxID=3162527 RepID=UPI003305DB4A
MICAIERPTASAAYGIHGARSTRPEATGRKARTSTLEQHVVDLEVVPQDHGDDLNAARATNHELMAQPNRRPDHSPN